MRAPILSYARQLSKFDSGVDLLPFTFATEVGEMPDGDVIPTSDDRKGRRSLVFIRLFSLSDTVVASSNLDRRPFRKRIYNKFLVCARQA